MAQFNAVYVRTATIGAGTVTLGPKVSKRFCTFAQAGAIDGDEIRSYIFEEGDDFEIGVGIYNSAGPTLTRPTVRLSSINGVVGTTKLTLGGNATVRIIAAVEDLVTQDTSGNVTIAGNLSTRAVKFPVPTRRSDAIYAIQAADFDGAGLIGTNNAAAMIWSLSSSLLTANSELKVTNAGIAPLFINATGAKFNVFDSATGIGYTQTVVAQGQTVKISPDGAGNWIADIGQAAFSNGYEKSIHFTSYSLSNGGPFFGISGTPTIGDVIGFDYSYDLVPSGPTRNTLSFRYTFLTNTVAELETAARNLESQIKFNATLNTILGPDNAQYFVALQSAPSPSPSWLLAMNQVWPFNPNNHPTAVVFNSPGHTATITMLNDLGGGAVSSALDIGSWIGRGRATRWAGLEPQIGARIAGEFISAETTGNSFDNHNHQPIYASWQVTILDPTPGIAKAEFGFTAGAFDFFCAGSWGNGAFNIHGGLLSLVDQGVSVGAATDPGPGGIALHPGSSITPAANGDLVFEATSNTAFKIKYKGSDGTVRSNTLTLS